MIEFLGFRSSGIFGYYEFVGKPTRLSTLLKLFFQSFSWAFEKCLVFMKLSVLMLNFAQLLNWPIKMCSIIWHPGFLQQPKHRHQVTSEIITYKTVILEKLNLHFLSFSRLKTQAVGFKTDTNISIDY